MFCKNCGAENPDGAKFCRKCGAPLTAADSGAGNENSTAGGEGWSSSDDIWNQDQNAAGQGQSADSSGQQDSGYGQNPEGSAQQDYDYFSQQGQNQYSNGGGQPAGGSGGGDQKNPGSTMAVVSLVLGIVGIVLCCIPVLGLIIGVVGLIFAILAKKKNGNKSGVRTGGLICSIIATVIGVIYLIYFIVVGVTAYNIYKNILGGDSAATEEIEEAVEEEEEEETEAAEETEEEEDADAEEDVSDAQEITFESLTAVDNDDCSIVITGITADSDWGFTVDLELENKTDGELTFSLDDSYVNSLYYGVSLYENVTAGNSAVTTLEFNDTEALLYDGVDDVEEIGLGDVTDIALVFDVFNEDYDDVANETTHIYPYGQENASSYVRDSADTDTVLADTDDFALTVIGCEYDSDWEEYNIMVYIENKTDETLNYTVYDASVNGYMCSPYWGTYIAGGCSAYDTVSWYAEDLEEIGITDPESEIESIELELEIYTDSYEDIYDETVTLNP